MMRKSEAEHLFELLRENYEGPLKLDVWNLNERPKDINLPQFEHPFFVVGFRNPSDSGDEASQQTRQKDQIVVWNQRGKQISIKHKQVMRLTERSQLSKSDVFVYDTRKRQFVPASHFRLPHQST